MKILDIAFINSYPVKLGYQSRVFYYSLALSKKTGYKIKQFCLNPYFIPRKKTLKFNDGNMEIHFCRTVLYTMAVFLIYPLFRIRNWLHVIPLIFPFIKMPKELRAALEWSDIIQVEGPWLVKWIRKYTTKPIVLIAHNVEFLLADSIMKHKCKGHPDFLKKFLMKILFKTEKEAITVSTKVFVVSQGDMNEIIKLYQANKSQFVLIPNGIDSSIYSSTKQINREYRIVNFRKIIIFTGSRHPPNIIAADFIKNKIAPLFREKNILFIIAGMVAEKSFIENVLCTGPIDFPEMLAYLKGADIAINPVPYGSGSNIKMFEYLAAELPIISTAKGVEGLHEQVKKNIIISDLNGFNEKIESLLEDDKLLQDLKKSSRKNQKYHDYNHITGQAIAYYEEIYNRGLS